MLILSRIFPGSDFGGLETVEVVRREMILDKFLQILERPLLDGGQYIQRWVILYIAGVLSSLQQYFNQPTPGIGIEEIINREENLPLHIEELRNRIFEVSLMKKFDN